jgi:hypothetical protein
MRFHHMTWLAAGLVSILVAAGCSNESSDPDAVGRAQVRLISPQVNGFELTRVSIDTNTGFSGNLVRDAQTGDFTGTLSLPTGVHELTGKAFVAATLVGVSNPVPVDIQAGAVNQVTIQILDIAGGSQPDFAPLLESLSHPAATTAGTVVLFASSAVDLDGTPVLYSWSDDCFDSIFTAPQAAVTGWSKTTAGTCLVTLTAESGGQSLTVSFSVAVFGAGADLGAVEVVGEFIAAPSPQLQFSVPDGSCYVDKFVDNASCSTPITSPGVAELSGWANVDGNNNTGSLTLFDDCGGAFGVQYQEPGYYIRANWLPPAQGGICRLTVRSVNQEGVVGEISMGVAVRSGTPREPTEGPSVSADVFLWDGGWTCSVFPGQEDVFCGTAPAGGRVDLSGGVSWGDSFPGSIVFTDDCGGAFAGDMDVSSGYFYFRWQAPGSPVEGCTVTVTATSLEGRSSSGSFRVDVL